MPVDDWLGHGVDVPTELPGGGDVGVGGHAPQLQPGLLQQGLLPARPQLAAASQHWQAVQQAGRQCCRLQAAPRSNRARATPSPHHSLTPAAPPQASAPTCSPRRSTSPRRTSSRCGRGQLLGVWLIFTGPPAKHAPLRPLPACQAMLSDRKSPCMRSSFSMNDLAVGGLALRARAGRASGPALPARTQHAAVPAALAGSPLAAVQGARGRGSRRHVPAAGLARTVLACCCGARRRCRDCPPPAGTTSWCP